MSTEEIKKVDAFLRKHRILTEFKRELNNYNRAYPNYKEYMVFAEHRNFLSGAFSWVNTRRGASFWMELHYDYLKLFG